MTDVNKPTVTASMILQDLKDGLTREAIGEKYGLKKPAVKKLFQNRHLRGKKTIKQKEDDFIFIDDIDEVSASEPVTGTEDINQQIDEIGGFEESEPVVEEVREIRESSNPFAE